MFATVSHCPPMGGDLRFTNDDLRVGGLMGATIVLDADLILDLRV
jgi:hypothetical protein